MWFVLVLCGILLGCASAAPPELSETSEGNGQAYRAYIFEVNTYQEVVYNGRPLAISYTYNGEGKPDIVYYSSSRDRAEDRRGSRTDPTDTGTYHVRLLSPGTGKNIPTKEFFAEFVILKRPVNIEAEKKQRAVYNGDPKRIQASVTPSVSLSISYFPNKELMDAAKETVENTPPGQRTTTQTFAGYRRVERPPTEPGTYHVWIYYAGDNNNESASEEVEFTILPP